MTGDVLFSRVAVTNFNVLSNVAIIKSPSDCLISHYFSFRDIDWTTENGNNPKI
jgi:hypothetical protein